MSDREDRKDGRAETVDKVLEAMRKALADGDTVVEGRTITRAQFVPRDAMEAFVSLLEKTWKEESAVKQSFTTGNAAKLREVLEWATSTIDVSPEVLDDTEDWENEVVCWVEELQSRARAALAAPTRNCDRFATVDETVGAFCTEDNPGGEPRMFVYEAIKWMMAPATQEGGE